MPRILKILVRLVLSLVGVVVLALGVIYGLSTAKLHRHYRVHVAPEEAAVTPEAVARGRHLAQSRGCADCHGADLGGAIVMDNPAMGQVYAPNLTPGQGSAVRGFETVDWVRAIRHGIATTGRPLFLMPSEDYSHLTSEDMSDLLAYLESLPAVNRDSKPVSLGPVARLLLVTGKIKLPADIIDHAKVRPAEVEPGVTVAYGRYLAVGCMGCHRPDFSGGKIAAGPPDWPPAADLRPITGAPTVHWAEADFIRALRTGRRPDGGQLSPVMPRSFGQMNDMELQALWTYLRSLKPASAG